MRTAALLVAALLMAARPLPADSVARIHDHRAHQVPSDEAPPDWRQHLASRGGRILGDERNLLFALKLDPELRGLVRFNEFQNVVEFGGVPPWRKAKLGDRCTDDDDLRLQVWLQGQGIDIRHRGVVADAVASAGRSASGGTLRRLQRQQGVPVWTAGRQSRDRPTSCRSDRG